MKKSKWFYVFVLLISVSMFWVIYSVITDESSISSKLDPIDAVYTGARNSMNYLTEVRSYPNEDIPDQGFVGAFDDMMIQKRKSTLNPIWETMGPVNIGGRTLALAIHPEDPDLLFAGSASGGLWKSTTGGAGLNAWQYVSTGFPVLGVGAIDIDPNNPDVMYIGTGEAYGTTENFPGIGPERTTRGSYGIGILKTTDGGDTWEKSLDWSLNQRRSVQKIQINPLRSETIWAATTDGVFRSRDNGVNWQLVHGIPMATDIVINPVDTNVVFIANGGMGSFGHGIYRSTDAGGSFEKANLLTGGGPFQFLGKAVLAISPSDPNIVMASIGNADGTIGATEDEIKTWLMRTEDGGDTWDLVFSSNELYATFQGWYSHAIAIHPEDPEIVWAAGQPFGLYKSVFGGSSFIEVKLNTSVPVESGDETNVYPYLGRWADHHELVIHPTMPDTMYIINDGGIFRTTDGGVTSENLNSGYQTTQFYNGVSNSNTSPDLFFGGLQDNNSIIYEGDLNWRRACGGDGSWTALNQSNNNEAYLSSQFGRICLSQNLFTQSTFVTRPDANDFPASTTNFITPFVLSPVDNSTLYLGGERIFKSIDEGLNWTITNDGFSLDGNAMSVLAASEQSVDVIYAASSPKVVRSNVYVTRNGGVTWRQITQDLPDRFPTDMAVDPNNDNVAYITFGGFGSSHVYKTNDGGDSWIDIGSGLPDVPTWSVTVDPENEFRVFVGNELGIYQTENGGLTWTNVNGNLPDAVFAMDLVISRSNRKLRVATHGNGAYEIDLDLIKSSVESNDRVLNFELEQNYPNPFNPSTTIQYQLESAGEVLLQVFDIQGRLVETLINGVQGAGAHQIQFDGSNIASGTYIYRLTASGEVLTKSMQLVK
ncbi:MAG: T9SS type A sorting domain-containing protein, partial [Balneolaceae bacterium]